MDEIARHLSVSKKTIYQFFKDKDEIVFIVTKQHLDRDRQRCEHEIFHADQNPVEELLMVSQFVRKNLANTNPSILFDLNKYHPKAWQLFVEYKQEFILAHLRRNLQKGVAQGYYRADLNVEIMARFHGEQMQMAFNTSLFPPARFHFAEIQGQLMEHYIHGILTDEGRKVLAHFHEKIKNNPHYAVF